jgi:hypothetical protein
VVLTQAGRRRLRELSGYMCGGELLRLGLRHGDKRPGVQGDVELALGEVGRRRSRGRRCRGQQERVVLMTLDS